MQHRNTFIALALVAAGYLLGRAESSPAYAAPDSAKMVDLLRDIARAQANQADALKSIARNSERCAR